MPTFNPSLENIFNMKQQPSNAEWAVLSFLESNLDQSFEVYFKPLLNGDTPDFIIMKENFGVIILHINEWNLDDYTAVSKKYWKHKSSQVRFLSPFEQAEKYKNELYNLHIGELFEKKLTNPEYWKIVKCVVYFHSNNDVDINNKLSSLHEGQDLDYHTKYLEEYGILNRRLLGKTYFINIWNKFRFNYQNTLFNKELYWSFFRHFQAPLHRIEDGIQINYSRAQKNLTSSEAGRRRKIKGVAGSGKTMVLAKCAVNAHLRTGGKVLILTYNISLINYIHDRINDIREEFYWNNFIITNYHQFFKDQAKKYAIPIDDLSSWENVNFFQNVSQLISKFDVVLIDEVQDYEQAWIDIIHGYFMNQDSEFIVFGDEKQNIYERELDTEKQIIVRSIPGKWNNSLKDTRRFDSAIAKLANQFQINFFANKYPPENISINLEFDYSPGLIEYHYFENFEPSQVVDHIYKFLSSQHIHSSDACILSSTIEHLRSIDKYIREKRMEKTTRMFETIEENQRFGNNKAMIEDIRKLRKKHFHMKSGTIKISTIHSFKGWDIDTLFLLIFDRDPKKLIGEDELTYTGITRSKKNIIVYNFKNKRYDDFFSRSVERKFNQINTTNSLNQLTDDDLPF
jgi:hypothetical protein